MGRRPRLLDLFCGQGGVSMGYHRAGFDVLGVDIAPQPRYPFESVRADALEYAREFGGLFDAIHASPPCQRYTRASWKQTNRDVHPDLLDETRQVLADLGRPWVIENVDGAPIRPPAVMLCGLMFGLKVFRHRWFESSALLLSPAHPKHGKRRIGVDGFCCVIGHGGGASSLARMRIPEGGDNKATWSRAMGIDWMTRDGLSQAIPPAYTEFVGRQLLNFLESQG